MDHQLTKQIQDWLNAKHETDADIRKGADILFRLNRDRFYHARACRQLKVYRFNIEYELGKFLKIRLDDMTIEEVGKMNEQVMPEAQAILGDAELPSSENDGVAVIRKGKRKDHDFLPKDIADLWDINAKRYKEIKSTYETLKSMEDKEPCDRYEYLKILSDLDKKYRADMLTYDSYVVTRADRDRVAKARLDENNSNKE